jgi:hypothetical protein
MTEATGIMTYQSLCAFLTVTGLVFQPLSSAAREPANGASTDTRPEAIQTSAKHSDAPKDSLAAPSASPPAISDQAQAVGDIAIQHGDRTFVIVDKIRGEIILYEDGRPTYSSAALTGMSLGDRLPPGALKVPTSHFTRLELKVTPAGRYTVSPERDPEYGMVLTINEIKGTDWDIAIHRVYLGDPRERRAERLHSPDPDGRHITFGCINVDRDTIHTLLRHLAKIRKTPLYILPQDTSETEAMFAPR